MLLSNTFSGVLSSVTPQQAPILLAKTATKPPSTTLLFGASKGLGMSTGHVTAGKLFSPKLINLFHALDQKDSMFPLFVRDLFDSSGRVVAEFYRHRLSGVEALTEEGITAVVWGYGINFCKTIYDNAIAGLGKLKRLPVLLPKLDVDLLPKKLTVLQKGFQQQLTPDMVNRFVLIDESLKKTNPNRYAKQVAHKAHLLALLTSDTLQQAYKLNGLGKLAATSLIPTLAVAIGAPALYQWITRRSLARAKQKQLDDQTTSNSNLSTRLTGNTVATPQFHGQSTTLPIAQSNTNPFQAFQPMIKPHEAPANKPVNTVANQYTTTDAPRFSGIGSRLLSTAMPTISYFLENEQASTLAFIDMPLATARAGMAYKRNIQDMWEKIIKEAVLIAVMFKGQRLIQDVTNRTMDRLTNSLSSLDFKPLKYLADTFANDTPAFKTQYQQALQHLSLPNGQWDNLTMVNTIQQYIHGKYQQQATHTPNLLLDMAELAGKIPVHHEWDQVAGKLLPKTIDITQKIKLDDIKVMLDSFKQLAQHINTNPTVPLKPLLEQTAKSKYIGFGVSYALGWVVVSLLLPQLQHYFTYKQTGDKHYYPGLADKNAIVV
jgi:hypothetical protein